MSPKRKKAIMIRRHIAAPDWLWMRVEAAARSDGRSINHLQPNRMILRLSCKCRFRFSGCWFLITSCRP